MALHHIMDYDYVTVYIFASCYVMTYVSLEVNLSFG